MEPICSKCFPGNMLDVTAYEAFIRENGARDVILVGGKGFPSSAIEGPLSENARLHFLNPIKRNARFVKTHDMLKFAGKQTGHEGVVHSDYSVIRSEFSDFLATVLTWQLIKPSRRRRFLTT